MFESVYAQSLTFNFIYNPIIIMSRTITVSIIIFIINFIVVVVVVLCVWEVGTVGKISDCQPWGPAGLNPRSGRGLNFGQPSFATPSVDRDVKPLV